MSRRTFTRDDHEPLSPEEGLELASKLEDWIRFSRHSPLVQAGHDLDVWIRKGGRGKRGRSPWVKVWEMSSMGCGPVPQDGIELRIDFYGTTPVLRTRAQWEGSTRAIKAALLAYFELE